jgi:hypothetical protein
MRKTLLASVLLFFMALTHAQSLQITDMSATAAPGGINVNLKTIAFNGAGYLSHDYTISGTTISLSVCYWFNATAPVLTFDDDFFIPVNEPGNYTVNVTVYNSSSAESCDYFSVADTASVSLLSSPDFETHVPSTGFYPNPTTGIATMASEMTRVDAITVYDISGKLLIAYDAGTRSIDLSGLSRGVYLIKVAAGGRSFAQQIIKK